MHSVFNISMDPGLIIICLFLFAIGLGVFIYYGDFTCGSNNEEPEQQNSSSCDSDSTVRVTSPIH